ncbi:MAG: hypothetical protein J6N70_02035, partial [Oribacterium sp.]|nr:hypothetical protein [Oribacterium sp.]
MVSMTGNDVVFILKGVNEYPLILAAQQIKIDFEQAKKKIDTGRVYHNPAFFPIIFCTSYIV